MSSHEQTANPAAIDNAKKSLTANTPQRVGQQTIRSPLLVSRDRPQECVKSDRRDIKISSRLLPKNVILGRHVSQKVRKNCFTRLHAASLFLLNEVQVVTNHLFGVAHEELPISDHGMVPSYPFDRGNLHDFNGFVVIGF